MAWHAFLLVFSQLSFLLPARFFLSAHLAVSLKVRDFFPLETDARPGGGGKSKERQDYDRDDRGRWLMLRKRGNICLEKLLAPCLNEYYRRDLLGKIPLVVTLSCGCSGLVEHAASAGVFV